MSNRINILLKTLRQLGIGFYFLLAFIIIIGIVLYLSKLIFPSLSVNFQAFLDILGWMVAIGLGLYVYNSSKNDTEENEYKKQISLLESLYSELEAISSEKREIKLIRTTVTTGNLQWVKNLFGPGLKPGHGIWNLNTPIYIENLNRTINNKETKNLKTVLIHINQKIELIGNYLVQFDKLPDKKEVREPIKNAIIKVIDETIGLVEDCKNFIKEEFKIKTPST